MDKIQMAHEWAIELLRAGDHSDDVVYCAWKYADAMQAEADKREKEEAAQKRKEIREMLNAPNTFVEREGQHFDDVCSDEMQAQRDAELYGTGFLKVTYDSNGVKYERLDPETISMCSSNIGLDSQVLKEWQPDWSQAPDGVTSWHMNEDKRSYWVVGSGVHLFEDKGVFLIEAWCSREPAPSFGYTGNWKNSLRERPE